MVAGLEGGLQRAWRAHAQPVLAVHWSPVTGRIVSGGEDCIYKVGLGL